MSYIKVLGTYAQTYFHHYHRIYERTSYFSSPASKLETMPGKLGELHRRPTVQISVKWNSTINLSRGKTKTIKTRHPEETR